MGDNKEFKDGVKQNTQNIYEVRLEEICRELIDVYCKMLIHNGKLFSLYEFYNWVDDHIASRLVQIINDYYVR